MSVKIPTVILLIEYPLDYSISVEKSDDLLDEVSSFCIKAGCNVKVYRITPLSISNHWFEAIQTEMNDQRVLNKTFFIISFSLAPTPLRCIRPGSSHLIYRLRRDGFRVFLLSDSSSVSRNALLNKIVTKTFAFCEIKAAMNEATSTSQHKEKELYLKTKEVQPPPPYFSTDTMPFRSCYCNDPYNAFVIGDSRPYTYNDWLPWPSKSYQ